MKNFVLLIAATSAWAQSGLDRPQIGMMLDATGTARAVAGLPGSLTLTGAAMAGVVSLGCAASCLMKADSSLIAGSQTIDAPPGPAVFAFDSAGAFVYFSGTKQLARWQGGALTPVPFTVAGEVLSIRSVNGAPQFAVRTGGMIDIVADGNAVLGILPRGAKQAILVRGGVVYSTDDAIVLRRDDASEISFPLKGAPSFVAMSADYVQIGAGYALRVTPGREQIFQLPEPAQ